MLFKKFAVVPLITVLISVAFLGYFVYQYFDGYTLLYKFRISVQALEVERGDSGLFAKTTFLLENRARSNLKVSYIQEKMYFRGTRVDVHHHNFARALDFLVPPFSNGTLTIRIPLNKNFQNENSTDVWHILLYIFVEDVPILGDLMRTEHVSFES